MSVIDKRHRRVDKSITNRIIQHTRHLGVNNSTDKKSVAANTSKRLLMKRSQSPARRTYGLGLKPLWKLRRDTGRILRDLCRQKDIELVEGKAMLDHVYMLLSVPPHYSIAMTVGYLKGKNAIRTHRDISKFKGTLFGRSFWARGYCVSTVGLDESCYTPIHPRSRTARANSRSGVT